VSNSWSSQPQFHRTLARVDNQSFIVEKGGSSAKSGWVISIYTAMTITLPIHDSNQWNHTHLLILVKALNQWPSIQIEKMWQEDYYQSPFVQRRREMAHPVPTKTKGFLQLSQAISA